MLVAIKRLGLVLGLMLGSLTRAGAQSTELRIGVVQTSSSPAMVSPPAPGYVAYLFPAAGSTAAGFPQRLRLSYYGNEHQNSYTLSPFQETKTSFMTESRLPVAQVWGARLTGETFSRSHFTPGTLW